MKLNAIKRGLVFVATLFVSLVVASPALAATVTYTGGDPLFEFDGGTGAASAEDLFGGMKNLMPGDSVKETITITNKGPRGRDIQVYLRAIVPEDGDADFLSKLSMSVKDDAGSEIFDDSGDTPDKTRGLTDYVLLTTLKQDASSTLTVTLDVPTSLGNDYADRLGKVDWEFMVIEQASEIIVEKTITSEPANGSYYEAGEKITYEISVKNDGTFELTDLTVVDKLTSQSWTIDSLAVDSEPKKFEASYTVKKSDAKAGKVTNTATCTTKDPSNPDVTVSASGTVDALTGVTPEPEPGKPSLALTKVVTSEPGSGTTYKTGEVVEYKVTVTNTGDVDLYDVVATDALTGDEWTVEKLEAGKSKEFTAKHTITAEDAAAGSLKNTASAEAKDEEGGSAASVTAKSSATVKTSEPEPEPSKPGLSVTKAVTSKPASGTAYKTGELVKYKITIKNTGNVDLFDVVTTDALTGDEWKAEKLEVGKTQEYTTSHKVTAADVKAGTLKNTAKAQAKDSAGASEASVTAKESTVTVRTASSQPVKPKTPTTTKRSTSATKTIPRTGDSFRPEIVGACALAAVALIVTAVMLRKRSR